MAFAQADPSASDLVGFAACIVSHGTVCGTRCSGTHVQSHVPRAFKQAEGIIEVGVCRQTTRVDSNRVGGRDTPVLKEGHVLLRRTCPQS